jgi:zinc resistance-associated protein
MKKTAIVIGSLMLVSAIAYPVFAHGPGWGWGRGHHMMGYGGDGPRGCWQYDRGNWNLPPEQRSKMDQLRKDFYSDSDALRQEIWNKSAERDSLLNSTDPDVEKLRTLQKQISDLKSEMSQKRLDFELRARKITPEGSYGKGYGRGYRKGYGKGYGGRMGGYGPGPCWN